MKVTFVAPPLNLSGGLKVVAIYAQQLQDFGHDVTVVSPPHPSTSAFSRLMKRLGLPRPPLKPQYPSHQSEVSVKHRLLKRHRAVRAEDVPDADVIVATWWETAEWIARMGPAKGRHVYLVQHHEVFDHMPRDRVEATYRAPMKKVAVARWLADVLAREYGQAGTVVVPNAIDRAQFFAPPRTKQARPTVGTLFHETEFKAFDTTLKVLRVLRDAFPDLRIVAFGARPPERYAGQLEGMDLTIAPAQSEIRHLYASCDVWLSCSRSEGFNLTAMEAMACRTPVVSTRTGWPEEAVKAGVNGLLAEVDDVAGLAAAVREILALPAPQWERLSEGAHATVAASSWEASARMFEAVLQQETQR